MKTSNAPRGAILKKLLIAAGVLILLFVLAFVGALLYFNDAYFKDLLQTQLKTALGREVAIDSVHVGLLSGEIDVSGLHVPNNKDKNWADPDSARIGKLHASAALWPAAFSGGKKLE